jgi:hypothetical protein
VESVEDLVRFPGPTVKRTQRASDKEGLDRKPMAPQPRTSRRGDSQPAKNDQRMKFRDKRQILVS